MRLIVLDKCVDFRDICLNLSREIPPEAIRGGILDFFRCNFRPEVDNYVISGTAVDNAGLDVPVELGNSRSNGSRDIREADFVSDERTYPIRQKRLRSVSPNMAEKCRGRRLWVAVLQDV